MTATLTFRNNMLQRDWDVTENFKHKHTIDNYIKTMELSGLHKFKNISFPDPMDEFLYNTAKEFQPKK